MASSMTSISTSLNPANNNEDDSKSRTRVSQACSRCRSRKDRCDGLRPSCSACASVGKPCIYESTTKKRGLPEGYVRGLEKLLALASRSIDGLEDVIGDILTREQVRKSWNSSAGDELHTAWKESQVLRDLESILSDAAQSSSVGQKRKRQAENEDEDTPEDGSMSPGNFGLQFHISSGPSGSINRITRLSPAAFHLPSNARQILDHYFAHTHCWFPILNRPQILKKFYEVSRANTPLQENDQTQDGDLATIWAILAYSSIQFAGSERLSPGTEPKNIAHKFLDMAHIYIPKVDNHCTTSHAQAFLLIALLNLGKCQWLTASIYSGNAVRIMLALRGKHKPKQTTKNFRAVLQGCFILDVVVAMHLGTTPHMQPSHLAEDSYMEEDGHEEWEPWAPPGIQPTERDPSFSISTFNQLTRIFVIMGQAISDSDVGARPAAIQDKLERLHQLVNSGFAGNTIPSAQSPPHHIYLRLTHLLAQLYLLSQPIDVGSGVLERAKLACNVLSLIELCANSSNLGLPQIPPLVADCIHFAISQADRSQSAFGPHYALPSYADFCSAAFEYRRQLSQTWPAFIVSESVVDYWNEQQLEAKVRVASRAYNNTKSTVLRPASFSSTPTALPYSDGSQTTLEPMSNNLISDVNESEAQLRNTSTTYNGWNIPQPTMPVSFSAGQSSAMTPGGQIVPSPGRDRTHSAATMLSQPQSMGLAMSSTSPGFPGDEIDALFHEMAQLDANEWTNERALGLKDFGFNDDLAFQAFCNDPERLTTPFGNVQPALSSNRQTWTFTEHGR